MKQSIFIEGMYSKQSFCFIFLQFFCLMALYGQFPNAHTFRYQGKTGLVSSEGEIIVEAKYKSIKPFNWPEVKYTLFQTGDSTGVISTDGRIGLAPQPSKPIIIGSFAAYYDIPKELLGLHLIDLDKGIEVLTDDSLRFKNVINSTPPILQLINPKRERYYLFKATGKLITSCDVGLFKIVVPNENCPIFRSVPDEKRGEYKMRYFDCDGRNIPTQEIEQKYPDIRKYPNPKLDAGHKSLMTIFGDPIPHAKSLPEHERIRLYKGTAPHPIEEKIRQKLTVHIIQVVETSKGSGAIVLKLPNDFGFVDANGEYIIPPVNSMIEVDGAWLKVRKDASVGIMTIEGKEILPIQFSMIDCFVNPYRYFPYTFRVRTHSAYEGMASHEGQVFLPETAFE